MNNWLLLPGGFRPGLDVNLLLDTTMESLRTNPALRIKVSA